MDNYFLYSLECVKILKQLFASGSVIFGKYSPRLRLGEYSSMITSPSANNRSILLTTRIYIAPCFQQPVITRNFLPCTTNTSCNGTGNFQPLGIVRV